MPKIGMPRGEKDECRQSETALLIFQSLYAAQRTEKESIFL